MITVASTLEEYRYISSIDGIGPNLAARIIAEIGDIEEFKSREALVAYAGLDPHIYQNEMITVASTLEEYRYILSIDGIGTNLAARIIAEIGDIEEFKSREALVAYAGLDPHIYQSGDQDGKHLKISKKGNKYLRCLLFLAVGCSIRGAKDNPVNRFYQKKKQQSNPLNSKAAKTACTAKLLKIIYGICKNKTTYER
ncbi:hypothetical protein DXD61_08805 [Eubacterium sp. TM06-47]|nr:hypothetical protein DXD61_08805 [Eubacterium sp. TM06-47]